MILPINKMVAINCFDISDGGQKKKRKKRRTKYVRVRYDRLNWKQRKHKVITATAAQHQ